MVDSRQPDAFFHHLDSIRSGSIRPPAFILELIKNDAAHLPKSVFFGLFERSRCVSRSLGSLKFQTEHIRADYMWKTAPAPDYEQELICLYGSIAPKSKVVLIIVG